MLCRKYHGGNALRGGVFAYAEACFGGVSVHRVKKSLKPAADIALYRLWESLSVGYDVGGDFYLNIRRPSYRQPTLQVERH